MKVIGMTRTNALIGLALLMGLAGCSGGDQQKAPEVASIATSDAPPPPTTTSSEEGRPRHRVDESAEDSQRLIAPWDACMKEHGADMDQQPNSSIQAAEEWSAAHKDAGKACLPKLPLLPWGEDHDNPAYQDNMHAWVQCMTAKGMKVAESPGDDESPWHYTSDTQPAGSDKIEQDCELQVMGPSDK
jgi:hypothetical protein